MVSTIHVVFKTHLDIGFTDSAANVTRRYLHEFLPRAIALAEELDRRGGEARFVWTTGSWLIHEALRTGSDTERDALERAIRAGRIRWHGLPLTSHSELMDAGLFAHGISIGRGLDARFGVETIAAKMTDVPGHTVGIVPLLARAGLGFLHLGVNAASAVPEVPEFFVWRAPGGTEVVVNYAQDYGTGDLGLAVAPDGESALHLAHSGDNHGPPSIAAIEELFARLRAAHPEARVIASTLDAFGAAVLRSRASLPVIEAEIGDSWIHGAASDPLLTSQLRALLRLRASWVDAGTVRADEPEIAVFSDALLLIAEHTWGKDLKTYLPDYANYEKADFQRARAADAVAPAGIAPAFAAYAWAPAQRANRSPLTYSAFEASWAEQRAHVDRALDALSPQRRSEAAAALEAARPAGDAGDRDGVAIDPTAIHDLGVYRARFGADGALVGLTDADGHDWAGPEHPLASLRHQTYDERDEQRWLDEYCRDLDENAFWAVPDQSKPGMSIADRLPARVFVPRVVSAHRVDGDDGTTAVLVLALPAEASQEWGAPRSIRLSYRFPSGGGQISITLDLAGRDASRLPEATWLAFRPRVGAAASWHLTKLGTPVDSRSVVRGGNRSLHAVADARLDGPRRAVLTPLDSPLVAVGEPALLRFDGRLPQPDDGIHVNLHNNVWGTNFRMWFDDDMRYRFTLDLA